MLVFQVLLRQEHPDKDPGETLRLQVRLPRFDAGVQGAAVADALGRQGTGQPRDPVDHLRPRETAMFGYQSRLIRIQFRSPVQSLGHVHVWRPPDRQFICFPTAYSGARWRQVKRPIAVARAWQAPRARAALDARPHRKTATG